MEDTKKQSRIAQPRLEAHHAEPARTIHDGAPDAVSDTPHCPRAALFYHFPSDAACSAKAASLIQENRLPDITRGVAILGVATSAPGVCVLLQFTHRGCLLPTRARTVCVCTLRLFRPT